MRMYLEFSSNPNHYKKLFKVMHKIKNSRYLEEMKEAQPFFAENEVELLSLLDLAFLVENVGVLPKTGGLECQNFWFVLMHDALLSFRREQKAKNGGSE